MVDKTARCVNIATGGRMGVGAAATAFMLKYPSCKLLHRCLTTEVLQQQPCSCCPMHAAHHDILLCCRWQDRCKGCCSIVRLVQHQGSREK